MTQEDIGYGVALMMLSAPFFCALHANSTRAFPGVLGISSGTNVCGGVQAAHHLHLGIAHLLTLYALNERPSSSKGAMIDAIMGEAHHGFWRKPLATELALCSVH